jgi:hypothetical protein
MELRKAVAYTEDWHRETGDRIDPPLRFVVAAAVLTNPWLDGGVGQDLSPEIERIAPLLADVLVPMVEERTGGPDGIEAFGKSSVVGLDGEIEHAAALIHTLRFGNPFRRMARADSYLSSATTRGAAGCHVVIPMTNKNDRGLRSHFISTEFVIPDAPRADEILVAIGASSGGRPFARIGDRTIDIAQGIGA